MDSLWHRQKSSPYIFEDRTREENTFRIHLLDSDGCVGSNVKQDGWRQHVDGPFYPCIRGCENLIAMGGFLQIFLQNYVDGRRLNTSTYRYMQPYVYKTSRNSICIQYNQ